MGLSKDDVLRLARAVTLPSGARAPLDDQVEWASVCEGFFALKLHTPALSDPADRGVLAASCRAALAPAADRSGTPIQSLIIEFVDELGTTVQTVRFGSPTQSPAQTPPQTGRSAQTPSQSAPAGHPPQAPKHPGAADLSPLEVAGSIIAVGAGKGGVGKSTIALNLAVGLARHGKRVGLLDGDIYGPSLPTLLGLHTLEQEASEGRLQPFLAHGVRAITIGKLVERDRPLIWRGPMAHGAFKQLLDRTDWGQLDHLIIDLPPGTGDVPLTMAQVLKLSGAVIVCTPQRVAQDDAVRAAGMFKQLGIEVLGVVENMSFFVGDDAKVYDIFGRGGAEQMAQRLGVPFLGAVPITMALRANSDRGDPSANFDPGTPLAAALEGLVTQLENQVALASMRSGSSRPALSIS
ncbi:MAG: Mrp/NBP35 family ATP-binding protein [Phycisphaerales bacterium]|nr:Mrp/NBP35 family ATP-binding protein [Phycisphaerales bacterium]